MIFDDHDVHDDWNISEAWLEEMRAATSGGTSTSRARWRRTGSTSTSATSRPSRTRRTSCSKRVKAADDAEADPRGVRLQGRPRDRRHALELLPRPRQHAARGDRLARGPRARGGQALDARRRGVGLGRTSTRPAASTTCWSATSLPWLLGRGHALRRGLERGGGRRRLGRARRRRPAEQLRQARRPRALGRVPGVVRAAARSCSAAVGGGRARASRPPRSSRCRATCTTPTCSRWASRRGTGRREQRLAGRLLALPQPARRRASAQSIRIGMSRELRGVTRALARARPGSRTRASAGA